MTIEGQIKTKSKNKQKIDIRQLKNKFTKKFLNGELTQILVLEPDEMAPEEFLAKVGTWLAICDLERRNKNLNGEARMGGF